MNLNFYRCKSCGQVAALVKNQGIPLCCCDQSLEFILPNYEDASEEKHVPVVQYDKSKRIVRINVGKTPHPSIKEHFIEWIAIETSNGMQFRKLHPGDDPEVIFHLDEDEKLVDVFCYCNLHSLWKANMKQTIYTK